MLPRYERRLNFNLPGRARPIVRPTRRTSKQTNHNHADFNRPRRPLVPSFQPTWEIVHPITARSNPASPLRTLCFNRPRRSYTSSVRDASSLGSGERVSTIRGDHTPRQACRTPFTISRSPGVSTNRDELSPHRVPATRAVHITRRVSIDHGDHPSYQIAAPPFPPVPIRISTYRANLVDRRSSSLRRRSSKVLFQPPEAIIRPDTA